ncbi:MAG: ribonuclease III [Candidatus Moraniibacteriota bacterium]|nr:MAG: ribonuclease III [Candidatus Moranbacteria bacterium]
MNDDFCMNDTFPTQQLAAALGITINQSAYFQEAMTHRSYLNEHKRYPYPHNERLEFLGDAVLELVVTEALYGQFPDKPEGELTALRAALVNSDMLSSIGESLGIESFLLMSRGEAKDKGRARTYLVANAVEAVIGALYLDQGYEAAKQFILSRVLVRLADVLEGKLYSDPKSRFQELAQEKLSVTPSYQVMKEWGPDHDRRFVAGVFVGEELVAEGEGLSKQEAQREAAKNALIKKGW